MKSRIQKNLIDAWRLDEVAEYSMELNFTPATVLDIGANVGIFSFAAHQRWPDALIVAYEPMPENAARFLELNKGPKFVFHQAAVRAFLGVSPIFVGDRDVTHGFHQLGRQSNITELVPCESALSLPSCELVKIDTEGCELEILKDLDLSQTKALVCEYHREEDAEQIVQLMGEAGFELIDHNQKEIGYGHLKFARPGQAVLASNAANAAGDQARVPLEVREEGAEAVRIKPGGRKLYLALTGHYTTQDALFTQSLIALLANPPLPIVMGFNFDPSVERSRNVLAKNFLETDCTHLLTIDSDIGFNRNDVARIASHAEKVVGGMYPLKTDTDHIAWCGNGLVQNPQGAREDGLQEVRYMGTGFLCIERSVFTEMIGALQDKITYQSDFAAADGSRRTEYAFFRQGVRKTEDGRARFLTEDWMFCQTWLDLGGKIFADTRVVLKHAGRAVWPLQIQEGNPFQAVPGCNAAAAAGKES